MTLRNSEETPREDGTAVEDVEKSIYDKKANDSASTKVGGEAEKPKDSPPAPPDGGFDAWLGVFAAFLVFLNTWGLTQTYGSFQTYYESVHLSNRSSSDISWIGSMQSFLVVIVGVFAGPLFDMGWLKPLLYAGSFLLVFGMMMLSLCTEYWQVFLAQGLVVGFGGGLIYIPAVALVTTQFTTKRPIAVGLASSGSSIGGIIYPLMFRNIQPRAGFGWAVRAMAFVILGTLIVSLAILSRHKQVVPAKKRTFATLFDFSALKEIRFLAFTVSLFFVFLGFYIPLYAEYNLRTSVDLAYNLVAVVNAASFFGRTLPFFVKNLPPIYNLTFWTSASAVLLFCWLGVHNVPGFIVWVVLYGFASGVIIAACPSAVAHPTLCPNLSMVGSRLGLSWASAAIGILIVSQAFLLTPSRLLPTIEMIALGGGYVTESTLTRAQGTPIAGVGVNIATASFIAGQSFSGAVMTVGALLMLVPSFAVLRYKGQSH